MIQKNSGQAGANRYSPPHMKSNGLASALTGAVMISAVTTGWVSARYFFAMREWQKLQGQYATMNNTRSAAQALANEALEYSRTNASIDPILYQYEIKARPGSNAPPTAAPAGIQPTRPGIK